MPKYIYTDLHSDYAYGLSAAVVIKGKKVDDEDTEDAVIARVVRPSTRNKLPLSHSRSLRSSGNRRSRIPLDHHMESG